MNWRTLITSRMLFWVVIGLVLVGAGVDVVRHYLDSADGPKPARSAEAPDATLNSPRALSAIDLVDGAGKPFGLASFKGRWSLVMLGYTHCPDVCPFTLSNLAAVHKEMAKRLTPDEMPTVVFVSVDPERDTVDKLDQYVRYFEPKFRAATGTKPKVDRFVAEIGGFYEFGRKRGEGAYEVNHSAEIFVIDPSGRLLAKLEPPLKPAATTELFRGLVAAYKSARTSKLAKRPGKDES